jgi:uncharacterized membrane protein YqiK
MDSKLVMFVLLLLPIVIVVVFLVSIGSQFFSNTFVCKKKKSK